MQKVICEHVSCLHNAPRHSALETELTLHIDNYQRGPRGLDDSGLSRSQHVLDGLGLGHIHHIGPCQVIYSVGDSPAAFDLAVTHARRFIGVDILIVIISHDFLGLRERTCNSADTSSHAEHEGKNFRYPHNDRLI